VIVPDGAAAAFLLHDWPSAQLRPLRALMRAYIDFGYLRLDAPLQLPAHAACDGLRPLPAALLLRHAEGAAVLLEAGALARPHSVDYLLEAAARVDDVDRGQRERRRHQRGGHERRHPLDDLADMHASPHEPGDLRRDEQHDGDDQWPRPTVRGHVDATDQDAPATGPGDRQRRSEQGDDEDIGDDREQAHRGGHYSAVSTAKRKASRNGSPSSDTQVSGY